MHREERHPGRGDRRPQGQTKCLLTPYNNYAGKHPRYYQEIAINRVVGSILKGQRRNLLTMATGTGKTTVAFQICWKLWSSGWNRDGRFGKPRILFLADRNILVDDPKDKDFLPFGDARMKIEGGEAVRTGRGAAWRAARYQLELFCSIVQSSWGVAAVLH